MAMLNEDGAGSLPGAIAGAMSFAIGWLPRGQWQGVSVIVAEGRPPAVDTRRAMVLHDRRLMVDLIELTLNHGRFVVRAASTLAEAEATLVEWQPHMCVVDMDHDDSSTLLELLGIANRLMRRTTPVLGLTRRGDLKTKLRAFDLGVDDILAMPFTPDELFALAIAMTRRATGADRPILPTIRFGEIETDIVSRQVRAGSLVVHLSGIEQSLLYLLASRNGRVVTREEIQRRGLGHRLRDREHDRGSPHPEPAFQARERRPSSTVHRDGPRAGLSVHPDLSIPGWGLRPRKKSARRRRCATDCQETGPGSPAPPLEAPGLDNPVALAGHQARRLPTA